MNSEGIELAINRGIRERPEIGLMEMKLRRTLQGLGAN